MPRTCATWAPAGPVPCARPRTSAAGPGSPSAYRHESVDDESEAILDDARRDVDLTIDWYVYPAGSSHLMVWLPIEEQVGGFDGLLERIKDPLVRQRVGTLLEERLVELHATGGREYFSETRTGRHIGRSIGDIAAERGRTLGEAAVELLEEESPDALLVFRRGTSEEDFDALARHTVAHPSFTVASDGVYHGALPHPRGYGCFARFLRRWVRETGALDLESGIRVMTGATAERFGIRDRGRLAEGLAADVVCSTPRPSPTARPGRHPADRPSASTRSS